MRRSAARRGRHAWCSGQVYVLLSRSTLSCSRVSRPHKRKVGNSPERPPEIFKVKITEWAGKGEGEASEDSDKQAKNQETAGR